MRLRGYWIAEQAAEVAEWCRRMTEYSTYELLYQGGILKFTPADDAEDLLFRLKWGHLI